MTDVRSENTADWTPTKVLTVRTAGALSWYRDISDPSKLGEWRDHADIEASRIPLLFVPTLVADDYGVGSLDGAGNGQLCAIPLMARVIKLLNGNLAFDIKRAEATVKARSDRWVEAFIDAVGVTGLDRKIASDLMKKLSLPSFKTLMGRTAIKVIKNTDGSFEITQTQSSGAVSVRMVFTPTTERTINPVFGKTYFERVTEEVKNSGLTPTEFLNK